MRNEGFICLWRKTQYDPIWFNSTPEQKAIFITLLFMANWKEQKYDIFGNEITLEAGSFIGSYTQIAKLTGKGVSIRNVRTAIDRFEKMGFLTRKPTKRGTLIIIVNWRKYQDKDYKTDTETDIELTRHRHGTDTAPTQDRHAHKRTIQPSNQVTIKPSNQKDIPPYIPPRGKDKAQEDSFDAEGSELISSFAGSNEELAEALRAWMDMRREMAKKRKEVFSIQALKMALKNLHKVSGGSDLKALEIVNRGVELSWKGFYPIRKKEPQAKDFGDVLDEYVDYAKEHSQ